MSKPRELPISHRQAWQIINLGNYWRATFRQAAMRREVDTETLQQFGPDGLRLMQDEERVQYNALLRAGVPLPSIHRRVREMMAESDFGARMAADLSAGGAATERLVDALRNGDSDAGE